MGRYRKPERASSVVWRASPTLLLLDVDVDVTVKSPHYLASPAPSPFAIDSQVRAPIWGGFTRTELVVATTQVALCPDVPVVCSALPARLAHHFSH